MALTKTIENDKIEIVNRWCVQIRSATIIKEDGKELSRSFERKVLKPGTLKGGTGSDKDDLVPTDISGEDSIVQGICNATWTDQVKADFKTHLIAAETENLIGD
jgi:hypothetical protein